LKRKPDPETRGIALALAAFALLFTVQLSVYFGTHILLMLGQAFETLSDVIVSLLLLLVIVWSKKPADEQHMFGHERAQNVAAVVAATILISLMSVEMYRQAITQLVHHSTPEIHNTTLAVVITAVGLIVIIAPAVILLRIEKKGAAAKAQFVGLVKDIGVCSVALVGIILVATGHRLADPISSIILATLIAAGAIYLLADNFHTLVGKAPDEAFMDKLKSIAMEVPGVLDVHGIKAEYVGRESVYVALHVNVASGTPIEEADRVAEVVRKEIKQHANCEYSEVHVDPEGLLT